MVNNLTGPVSQVKMSNIVQSLHILHNIAKKIHAILENHAYFCNASAVLYCQSDTQILVDFLQLLQTTFVRLQFCDFID